MTRLGHVTMRGAMVVLVLMAAASTYANRESSRSATWGSAYAIPEPDPGFWRSYPGEAPVSPRTYSAGMSRLVATSRVTVLPNSGLELTNLGASGALVLASGGLVLTGAEGILELRRGDETIATELAPVGIGSRLERGDRLAYRSSATIAFRNPEETAASLLMMTELPDLPLGGALQ